MVGVSESLLQNALNLRRAGRLGDAARIYEDLLATEPGNFEALHALGIIRYQTGQIEDAERLIGKAVAMKPEAHDAHYNRACLLQKLSRPEDALAAFDRAVSLKPDYVEALVNRASVLTALKRHDDALASLDQVLALRSSIAEVWNNKAGALTALNRSEEALASYDRAVALKPGYVEAWKNRGILLITLGRAQDALESFDKVLGLDSNNSQALRSRADILFVLKRSEEAAASYQKYLAQKLDDADAWTQHGIALIELNRHGDALGSFGKAITLDPANADAWNHRGHVHFALKRFEEAAHDYARALSLAPDLPYGLGYLAQSRLRSCDWSQIEEDRRKIAAGLREGRRVIDPFGNLIVSDSLEDQLQCARIEMAQSNSAGLPRFWQGESYRHDRIRLAYLSADFRPHPVAFLIAGVFEHHDKSRFEMTAISFGPDDRSEMRTRISSAFDRFIDVRSQTDIEVAALLRQMEIDIAVDLTGFCEHGRPEILSYRPAPLQVNYLGFPGTLGADIIDYIIADQIIIPPRQSHLFSEEVAYLPNSYQANDRKRRIAAHTPTRSEVGLPAIGTVFCAFNNAYKITPEMFDVWMRLISAVEGSVLWLLGDNPAAIRNLKHEAELRGIASDRLIFAPRVGPEEHLARFRLADLFLDTLPYNAHTTASDALWAGVPVVTCQGSTFAGRVAGSLLSAVGLSELVTDSIANYEALCLKLGRDGEALSRLKQELVFKGLDCRLFDTMRFTRHLEAAYMQMRLKAQRGERPKSFSIEDRP
jgi:predicted O-linked N-acetylglucosamine transferase (SPINDLY family)